MTATTHHRPRRHRDDRLARRDRCRRRRPRQRRHHGRRGRGQAAGISLDVGGAPIPVLGFAVLTAFFSLVGLVLAVVLSRVARRPRSTFIRTTVVLTVLSLVPDVIADAAPATKALLMLTHLVAAAIVIPAVARRLSA